jgi:hypothetical protein
MATKVDTLSATPIQKVVNMSSFFQARLAETPKKPMPPAPDSLSVEEEKLPEKETIC